MRLLLGIACSLFLVSVTFGQSDRGTLTGTVSDPNGLLKVNNAGFSAIATFPGNAVSGERTGLLVGRLTF